MWKSVPKSVSLSSQRKDWRSPARKSFFWYATDDTEYNFWRQPSTILCSVWYPTANPSLGMIKTKILRHLFPWHSSYMHTEIKKMTLTCLSYHSLKSGGCISYVSSLSTGIIALIDASECSPTFGAGILNRLLIFFKWDFLKEGLYNISHSSFYPEIITFDHVSFFYGA